MFLFVYALFLGIFERALSPHAHNHSIPTECRGCLWGGLGHPSLTISVRSASEMLSALDHASPAPPSTFSTHTHAVFIYHV
jgi:hypothetical protein